jgi:hypothetical protein
LNEDAKKIRAAQQSLRDLRATLQLAQKMGGGLGRGEVLLGPLPPNQKD